MRSKTTYAEQLLDPRWQKKRLEVLDYSDFACEVCGDGESTLHVHHKQYIKGRQVWEYDIDQLACLCADCHKDQHGIEEAFHDLIARIPLDGPGNKNEVYYLIAGYIGQEVDYEYEHEKTIYELGNSCLNWWKNK